MSSSIRSKAKYRTLGLIVSMCLTVALGVLVPVGSAFGQAQTYGQWSTLSYTMPINPVHATLLHNGKILIVAGSGNYPANLTNGILQAAVWDLSTGNITVQSVSYDMFCSGMVGLADGREFIFGGTLQYDPPAFEGLATTSTFDLSTGTFTTQQIMAHGRWYPTGTVLGNGSIMVFSGVNETSGTNTAVEIYTPGSGWSTEYPAGWTPPLYPRMHLLPNGKVFYSGSTSPSRTFNPSTLTWTTGPSFTNSPRTYGSSVLLPLTPQNNYRPKVLIMGGGNPATNTAETIDLGASSPTWTPTANNMSAGRIEMNAVILPSGKVLAVGGSPDDEIASTSTLAADLYDPTTNMFGPAGTEVYPRLYHSIALLLPDATVMVAGGNPSRGSYEPHIEIYQPAYLFTSTGSLATRPTISSAPSSIGYGSAFQISTAAASSIASVVLMRNGSVTHAFDMDQRMVGLSFTAGSGVLTVTGPPNANIAPPGYYMLFLLNSSGVPSLAKFVQVGTSTTSSNNIALVQKNAATPQSPQSTVTVAYPAAQTAGDLNVVVVGWNDTTSSLSSISDTAGNLYTAAVGPTTGTGLRQAIYYAAGIAGSSSNTVKVIFNQAANFVDVRVLEYSGASTSSPVDGTPAAAAGSGSLANSGPTSTTTANDLIFGAGTTGGVITGPGSGFISRVLTQDGDIAEDMTGATAGSYSATAPVTPYAGTSTWVMQAIAFKPGP